jgi:hypothetical protein
VEQFRKILRAYNILIKNFEGKNSVERIFGRSDNNIKKECRRWDVSMWCSILMALMVKVKVKVKQSHYRP